MISFQKSGSDTLRLVKHSIVGEEGISILGWVRHNREQNRPPGKDHRAPDAPFPLGFLEEKPLCVCWSRPCHLYLKASLLGGGFVERFAI